MSSELIIGLRVPSHAQSSVLAADYMNKAADALQAAAEREEKLRAEVARLEKGIFVDGDGAVTWSFEAYDKIEAERVAYIDRIKALEEGLRHIRNQDRVVRFMGTEDQYYEDGPSGKIAAILLNGASDA